MTGRGSAKTRPHAVRRSGRFQPINQSVSKPASHTSSDKKRQRDEEDEATTATANKKYKRAPLTQKNLRILGEMEEKGSTTGPTPDEFALKPSMSKTGKTASATASGFAMQADKNGILPMRLSKAPENVDEIRQRYNASRGTASPTHSMYEYYVNTVATAPNESTMAAVGAGVLLKNYYTDKGYKKVYNQAFTGIPEDAGFNNGLSAPKPSFFEGLLVDEYEPFPVHEYVKGGRLIKDNINSLSLPYIAGEWKGPGEDMELAKLQSSYDGAALVYGRQRALAYLDESDPADHAEVTTFTTDGTNLNLYAHHATHTEDGKVKYHQYPIKSVNLVESFQTFKEGRRGLRNEQDHARDQSYALRDRLRSRWTAGQALQV